MKQSARRWNWWYFPALVLLVGPLRGEPSAQTVCFPGTSSIQCGQNSLRGTLAVIGTPGRPLLSFDAQRNEVVSITVAEDPPNPTGNFEPFWALYPPSFAGGPPCGMNALFLQHTLPNTRACDVQNPQQCFDRACLGQCESAPLPATGTYTIAVFDLNGDGSGNYRIGLGPASATFNGGICPGTLPIHFGDTITRFIGLFGQVDTFTFAAPAGAAATIRLTPSAGDPNNIIQPFARVFGPDGTLLAFRPGPGVFLGQPKACGTPNGATCTTAPLPEPGGTFTLEVADYLSDGTGAYELSLTSCGNGNLERGESCDAGALNGTAGSCCNANCTFRAAGQPCRPAANVCDAAETCTGTSGVCPPDGVAPPGTTCADGDLCTLEDSCQAGKCMGRRVCTVDVEIVQNSIAIKSKRVQIKKAPIIVTCNSFETGQAQRGSCSAQGVEPSRPVLSRSLHGSARKPGTWHFIHPEDDGVGSCDTGTPVTKSKTVSFNAAGIAILRLKVNPLGRQALKKLIKKQPVFVTVCVTVTRPNGDHITVPRLAQLSSPCSGGRPSSVCGVVSPAERAEP